MTASVEALARAAASSRVADEWIVRERQRVTLSRELGDAGTSTEATTRCFDVLIFRDRRQTRGEASFTLTPQQDDMAPQLSAAGERARRNIGPLWRLPPPAAPARVNLADSVFIAAPADSLVEVAAKLAAADKRTRIPAARVDLITSRVRVRASTGYDYEYIATELRVIATLQVGDKRLRTTRRFDRSVRRLTDLRLPEALASAIDGLTRRAGAEQTPPGRFDLVLSDGALRWANRRASWLSPIARQASAALARRGLARYQPGQTVARGGSRGDAVTLTSEGTRPFALESAPFDLWGGPVRRFALIRDGRAAGLALDQREAALAGRPANGGVRNPTLSLGSRSASALSDGSLPRLTITDLAWLEASDATGAVAAEVDLATLEGLPNQAARLVTGGQLSFNLFEALGRIRLGADAIDIGPGAGGPQWIGIPDVEVR